MNKEASVVPTRVRWHSCRCTHGSSLHRHSICVRSLAAAGLENDQYIRQTEGYLPTAEVAFVDEIFKVRVLRMKFLQSLKVNPLHGAMRRHVWARALDPASCGLHALRTHLLLPYSTCRTIRRHFRLNAMFTRIACVPHAPTPA